MKKFLTVAAVALSLSGCLGYRIGSVKPRYLEGVQSIAIPTFHNKTSQPRIEVPLTSTVIKQLQQDGTYKIASEDKADATLQGTIISVGRAPARSLRGNALATTEFSLSITLSFSLVARDGRVLLGPTAVGGVTNFFVGTDVATDQRQALPLAMEDLAVRITSQLSEGW